MTHIPELFRERFVQKPPPKKQLNRYFRMIRRDKRVGSYVQAHFERFSEEQLVQAEIRYSKRIDQLYRLAKKLVRGELGEPLQIAAVGESEELFTKEALLLLLSKREKEILTSQTVSDLDALQEKIQIPERDMGALIRLFKQFIGNLSTPSHLTVEMILERECEADDAIGIAHQIKNKEERERAYCQIIYCILAANENDCFAKAFLILDKIEEDKGKVKPLISMIDRAEGEELEKLIKVVDKMEDPNRLLQRVALRMCQLNCPFRVREILERVSSDEERGYICSALVHVFVQKKWFNTALILLASLENSDYREDAIGYLSKVLMSSFKPRR